MALSQTKSRIHDLHVETQTQGQVQTSRSWYLVLNFVSTPCLLNPFKIFIKLCSNINFSEIVCRANVLASWSRSQFKVMGFTIEFPVHPIFPEPFERFSLNFTQMLLSDVIQNLRHRLMVKVTQSSWDPP